MQTSVRSASFSSRILDERPCGLRVAKRLCRDARSEQECGECQSDGRGDEGCANPQISAEQPAGQRAKRDDAQHHQAVSGGDATEERVRDRACRRVLTTVWFREAAMAAKNMPARAGGSSASSEPMMAPPAETAMNRPYRESGVW